MNELHIVIFSVGGQQFGAETSQVFQIIRYREPVKAPKMPRFIEGMLNFRDSVIPVVNLSKRFGMGETAPTKKMKILVVKIEDRCIGFIVDDVIEIAKFAEGDIDPAPAILRTVAADYIRKVGKRGEKLISIVDLENVLSGNEIKKIKQ